MKHFVALLLLTTNAHAAIYVDGVKVKPPNQCIEAYSDWPLYPGSIPGSNERLKLSADGGVFSGNAAYGYRLIQKAFDEIRSRPVQRVLVVGSGTGYEAIAIARTFPNIKIDATDVYEPAVHATRENAAKYQVADRIKSYRSDLLAQAQGPYDLILFNAPKPEYRDELYHEFEPEVAARFWMEMMSKPDFYDLNGVVLQRFLAQFPRHLTDGGAVLLMTDEKMRAALPEGFTATPLSKDDWGLNKTSGKNFAIQRIAKFAAHP